MSQQPENKVRQVRTPLWASLLAGAGAGVAVVNFLAAPWPWGFFAVPALALWTVLVATMTNRRKRRTSERTLLILAGVISIMLGSGLSFLLAALP